MAGEVALAFVLLVSMMLVGRSLLNVLDVDAGFDPRGALLLKVSTPPGRIQRTNASRRSTKSSSDRSKNGSASARWESWTKFR